VSEVAGTRSAPLYRLGLKVTCGCPNPPDPRPHAWSSSVILVGVHRRLGGLAISGISLSLALSVWVAGVAPAGAHSDSKYQQRVLFMHVSPDGSRVVARRTFISMKSCTASEPAPTGACAPTAGRVAATEFDFTVDRHIYRWVVLASDSRLSEAGLMNPIFTDRTQMVGKAANNKADLIILHVRPPVTDVRLPRSGRGGASPQGDHMSPRDGWVVFPIHNFKNLGNPEAFNSSGKMIGSSVPFPCC
jgi:hypothetical protein